MFAKLVFVFALVGVSVAANVRNEENENVRPQEGVDPNTLSCDPEGQIFLLLPHFTDCTKFFMCANGEEVLFSCPSQTIFDFELQGCDWESSARCILRDQDDGSGDIEGSGEEEEGSGFFQPEEVESYAVESDVLQSEQEAIFERILDCRKPESAARHVPYKGDCQRYWRCVDGAIQAAYCSDGLFFNAQTQQCDFEANSRCDVPQENELEGEFIVYK